MPVVKKTYKGHKYKYHAHKAKWSVLTKTYVYKYPFTSSGKVSDTKLAAGKMYYSEYKGTADGESWYYLPKFKGWVPWKLSGKQIVRRYGDVEYCELADAKTKSNSTPAKKDKDIKPIIRIPSILDTSDEEYKNMLRSNMIIKEDSNLWNIKFNRLQFANPYYAIGPTREYLFFTKMDLHIRNPGTTNLNSELSNDPFWVEMNTKYKRVIHQMQLSADGSDNMPFMPILTNASVSSLDLPSISSEASETGQTIYGTSIQYARGGFKSDESFDFSLEFTDNPWLDVYHFFKMYNEYEKLKQLGIVTPPRYENSNSKKTSGLNKYIVDKILHDQIGIYKFIVDDDMETILYYAYMWGCFPKSVPRETFKDVEIGSMRYSVDWHAQFVDDMNPEILVDFNELCTQYINPDKDSMKSIWDDKNKHIDGNWRSCPLITISKDSRRPTGVRYKLKWFDKAK